MLPNDTECLASITGDRLARFWDKVDKRGPDECWEWKGGTCYKGYGRVVGTLPGRNDRRIRAHRVAYTLMVGLIPDGLVIDHLCRNRRCVNPAHMEVVTPSVNTLRGVGSPALNALKTHCKHGHEFTPNNTDKATGGGRSCRECAARRRAEHYARLKAKRKLS